jgi:hypothetical protein
MLCQLKLPVSTLAVSAHTNEKGAAAPFSKNLLGPAANWSTIFPMPGQCAYQAQPDSQHCVSFWLGNRCRQHNQLRSLVQQRNALLFLLCHQVDGSVLVHGVAFNAMVDQNGGKGIKAQTLAQTTNLQQPE